MYLIYINPLNKNFKGQYTYEFIFTKRLDNVEYGDDWDVQPASSGLPTPPNVRQIESIGMLKSDDIELDFTEGAISQLAENTMKLKTGARGLHTEIEKVLMPHIYNTKKYRENNIKKININQEQILQPKAAI